MLTTSMFLQFPQLLHYFQKLRAQCGYFTFQPLIIMLKHRHLPGKSLKAFQGRQRDTYHPIVAIK